MSLASYYHQPKTHRSGPPTRDPPVFTPTPTTLGFKEFNYDNCSLIDCISLLQSVLNYPHAYSQNKAFTKYIVDALMQSYEEKLELEVSIPRKLYDEWEPTIKIKIKIS